MNGITKNGNYQEVNLSSLLLFRIWPKFETVKDIEYHDAQHYFSIKTKTSHEPTILLEEDVLDTTITYDRYNDKELTRVMSVYNQTNSDCLGERTTSHRVNRGETKFTREYPSSGLRQLELQSKETQNLLRATIRRTELLSDVLIDTQAELTRVYEQRDSYMNNVHDLRGELAQMKAQLEEVETRNYTLTKDYEALERDNACLRRYSDELTKELQGALSQKVRNAPLHYGTRYLHNSSKDRRDLHHIRRRILVDKAIEALKRRYCVLYPMGPNESFYSWSKRVGYPRWERLASMVMDAKYHGNKSAHQATQAEMLQTVTLALEDDLESGYTGEGEVLRDMYNIVYQEPEGMADR
ncbi:hypothetical protein C0995_012610 [Termitomyces sp. Mi166|nr:hypothetical protein C0995_012610 [Termitomyces sp. Mi166\